MISKKSVQNYKIKPAFTDARGHIFDIVEEPISHVGLITFKKGAIRGNHYHKKSVQYTYILKGKRKKTFILTEGMFSRISPQIVHAYKALTSAAMLDMSTLVRGEKGYEDDTVRVKIL